ncbi:NAD-dependent epimerase/dehydratase family protein [Isoalcanivorax beigongshangi]|uniref:NAD-dependent epimerase/dehydratase family protein n=1 Tax=Isoalcanivorax beigongshangi TaxID=3238810 RepID=A0ABV4AJ17_9GAMM
MKAAITGASGFIGSHLIDRLSRESIEVVALSRRALYDLPENTTWVKIDSLEDVGNWSSHLHGVSVLYHLAGMAHQTRLQGNEALRAFERINVDATLLLAEHALKSGVGVFIYMSSIGVHGAETYAPLVPDSSVDPVDDYAVSKLKAENKLRAIFEGTSTRLIIVRPPMVYALSAPGNFQRLVRAVNIGVPLPFGLSRNKRSLISVYNLCDVLWLTFKRQLPSGTIILPCEAELRSTARIVKGIAVALKKPARLLPVPVFIMNWAAWLLGKRRAATKILGDFEIDPQALEDQLGLRFSGSFEDELCRGMSQGKTTSRKFTQPA